jgi:D-serine dehydratase
LGEVWVHGDELLHLEGERHDIVVWVLECWGLGVGPGGVSFGLCRYMYLFGG